MQTYRVMAVPLFSGGGVKIKVVEGMFLGKPIVTTNSGAEGINYTEGQELFIRETPEAFAEALCDLLQNESLADHLGKNAEKSAQENHKLSRVTEKLCDFYRTIIAK
jgi:glycosyltransferase involved in cell wall biosynthesis